MISYGNGLVTNINLNNTNEKEVVQMKGDIHSGYLKGMGFYK